MVADIIADSRATSPGIRNSGKTGGWIAVIRRCATYAGDPVSEQEECHSMPHTANIAGTWNSNFGPVNITQVGQAVGGTWYQEPGKEGRIEAGSYNPNSGVLTFGYYLPWKNMRGNAQFQLSSDGNRFDGTYTQQDGQGVWTMHR
jgi:hypothetical protein